MQDQPASPSSIVLMGLRASGKSTLGAALASRLSRPFVDLDDRTLDLLGMPTASEAWDRLGEPAFRAAEVRALREALATPGQVIALGGGTPTAPGAAELLRGAQNNRLVYLRCQPHVLRERLSRSGGPGANRPSLTGKDPLAEIDTVFAQRDPLYRSLATHVIESSAVPDELIAELISVCG